ncbi:PPPDE putative thiol peptidase family protein [Actinidia rufa]|uniref:PPPDE putative thiol peptidase family protein n=1 Tax=Actinidia rufa TaxID=165716 RepID=A0A7J0GHL4_9ERIC|nr:PPPDE putative thiol peptidase family protein [Actinidia rufa]
MVVFSVTVCYGFSGNVLMANQPPVLHISKKSNQLAMVQAIHRLYLNVYDLTPMNGYVYWAGFGIFHSGVEVHGVEYAFGAHDYTSSGIFEVEPRQCPGFMFRKSILIGTTCLDADQVREFMERISANYNGDSYHLIVKNCNHFCKDILLQADREIHSEMGKSPGQTRFKVQLCITRIT